MPVTITDIDMGWDAYVSGMDVVDGAQVESGLHDPEQAEIGAWNELGTSKNPARPWMSRAGDTGQEAIFAAGAEAAGEVADGGDAMKAYTELGGVVLQLETDVVLNQNVGGPALAASTVKDKKHGMKLVASGDMIASMTSEVTL